MDQKKPEVWVPLSRLWNSADDETKHQLFVAARLAPGATLAQARTQMDGIEQRLAELNPKHNKGWMVSVFPFEVEDTPPTLHRALYVLLAAVGILLLITCANLANLTLARATLRSREISIRLALGATRGRIMRQLIAESLLVSLAGATAGLAARALVRPGHAGAESVGHPAAGADRDQLDRIRLRGCIEPAHHLAVRPDAIHRRSRPRT